ncbi:MAG: STAS/SEC14 domain-containing protein [Mesorhizobium sp.]|nr:MAG: STAS/SEC14 domain-containing protein [Mesorhizobium sp.]
MFGMIPKTNPKEEKVIEVISAPGNVAAFRVAGTVTAEDYDKIIPTIEEKLSEHEEIGIQADLTDLEDMTGDALRRDLQYGLSKLGELHRFQRAAVVSEKQWIKAATEMTGALFPQIEARVFPADEKTQALAWVARVQ